MPNDIAEMTTPEWTPVAACDHVIGSLGGRILRVDEWTHFVAQFSRAVEFFNATKFAVPHPGFLSVHPYCSSCGSKNDSETLRASICDALEAPSGPGFSRESYTDWVYSRSSPGGATKPANASNEYSV